MVNPRAARVADQIKQVIARMVDGKLKDPRLGMVTITDVRVTGDLQHATIFYTVYGSAEQLKQSGRALESAKGMLRSAVGNALGLRLTPSLEFVPDALPEAAASIEDALVAARFKDEQVRKLAQNAQYAGAADPYKVKHPAELADAAADAEAVSQWAAQE
ncbi:30S ribosome-binding factor RbfA [Arcanobacterium hippocoleae]|uniref:Ribosome-binding factor A n=1 Tax=Arcanobacterium hippocoleae TaxID=149017 RepID=A0ABU1T128_9ACTO|nr:30S ribosome-binding factor RbfA [Arcanobacterium hippocoleae]MDR6939070.1 ribosome-binding factor A [Arcanobacterium hippocoleae]